jgi:hypothetical protein
VNWVPKLYVGLSRELGALPATSSPSHAHAMDANGCGAAAGSKQADMVCATSQIQQVALGGLLQKLVAVFIAGIPLVVVGGLMYAFIAQEDVMAGFLVSFAKGAEHIEGRMGLFDAAKLWALWLHALSP